MCTSLILQGPPGHVLLLGNRDELRIRQRALAPELPVDVDGVRTIHPVDADALGTWMGVNEYGLVLTLLNNYQAGAVHSPEPPFVSRGTIARELLASRTLDALRASVGALDDRIAHVRPFVLAAVLPSGEGLEGVRVRWDGHELVLEELGLPALIISSGFDLDGVTRARTDELEAMLEEVWDGTPEHAASLSRRFGSPHVEQPDAYSLFMRRDDARTVSHTRIEATPGGVALHYAGVEPDERLDDAAVASVTMERIR